MPDTADRKIVDALAHDARLSLKELAARAGLSSPACSERLRRLEERGVLLGYAADVSLDALGYPLQAIMRVRPLPGMLHIVEKIILETPEIIECDKITGDDCFVCRVAVRNMADLDRVHDRITEKAQTNTAMVKSTPLKRRLPPVL
ncbi:MULTISPECIES: Lrp/AsnC family transcriptional regulator [Rhizobium/Agrobacterium group]|uniref:Lrp/AsnC family transcriptional regulator n=1 Tax=Rhizobium/Agrobacterium group TaxID=227290 RepID=UPI0006B9A5BF|nr:MULTISPECIES: Lrp/AsnC family transcriptional regulator [Rhizobium/Agrobacterium group]KPF53013.1 AsnC family transcriptional regulator [Rhizobium sp. AAP116]MDM7982386.1 Lrp/AsnC family transcriptional regulator [Rhizobium sp.]MDM8014812.1 Lrp/AsnC family transcriptional regulator [Rhizobium sp.]